MSLGASLVLAGLTWLPGGPAQANVALTRADIEAIRNRVELIPRGRAARAAHSRDFMAVGDTLRTAAQSQAQLRFNDGSLARVGERATFQFLPNTRNFRLSNGTMLLLIPPGRGRSTIQTPSAITGIQGSAVVVRHIEDRDLTIIMALTNNPAGPMTVTTLGCDDGSESCVSEHALYAGQMALVQDNQVQILEFDLTTFYDTSPLTDGLDLNNPDPEVSLGADLDLVRTETLEALDRGGGFADATLLNPAAVAIAPSEQRAENEPRLLLPPTVAETQPDGRLRGGTPVNSSLPGISPSLTRQPFTNQQPVAQPPAPTIAPPSVAPPAPQSPAPQPPAPQPPAPEPPAPQPPAPQPPAPQPPAPQPPAPQPPAPEPPVPQPPAPEPPAPQPPAPQPPAPEPPAPQPPAPQPPIPEPPAPQPPVPEPPAPQPPTGPVVPADPPPFRPEPPVPADPPAEPPVTFDPPEKDPGVP